MNSMNMGAMNPGNPAMGGGMPMMNNGANGVQIRHPEDHEETNYESRLNTYIYGYFLKKGQWDLARSLKNSGEQFEPPLVHGDGNINGADNEDSKDGLDSKRPDDLPQVGDEAGGSFLLSWFALFWDIYWAQRKSSRATPTATHFVSISQQQARQRDQQQQQLMRNMPGMMPGMENYQAQMMRQNQMMGAGNGDMRRGVLQNNQVRPNPQQMAQFQQNMRAQQQQQMMNQMRRDPSGMNGERPRTPGGADHAPSPSKRQRLDGAPFNGAQMMPNGRPMPQGMPGQPMMQHNDPAAHHANQLLMNNGINPGNLSDSQFASFQQQNPSVQAKSIQVYAQNMTKHQGDRMKTAGGMSDGGSPMMAPGMNLGGGDDFFANNAGQQMRNGAMLPNGAPNGTGGNHALQDYQMQLMLLEQQNKKRLLMARQEQDTITRPEGQQGIPGQAGFGAPGMSPQGSRGGPSPQPGDQARRGTPKMGQPGMPGSPMPDGRMTGSPAAMNFNNMDPALFTGQINGRPMQPPPGSNPAFNGGQFTPQQMEAIARNQGGVRMPNGQWQQGPQGQAPMMGQPGPPPPPQMGTPQQRNDMPPPQGVPAAAAANGRPGSPAAPPTPSQSNKANPKTKKDPKAKKQTKKNSTASVAATPAADGEPPATPTPSTPITPQHHNSFAPGKSDVQGPANAMQNANAAAPSQVAPPQPDPSAAPQFGNIDGTDGTDYSMTYNDNLSDPNLLENFDFEQFLQGDAFSFDAAAFDPEGIEATGMGDA